MAGSQISTATPTAPMGNADPVLAALATEQDAAQAYEAAMPALEQAGVFGPESITPAMLSWELYRYADLQEAEASASKALTQAERSVLSAKPQSAQGAAALLGFMRRFIADDPSMPASARRIIATITNVEVFLLGTLGWQCCRKSATQ